METIRVRVVCPFCRASRPFVGMGDRFLLTAQGQFHVYECACGAVGAAVGGRVLRAPPLLDDVRTALCTEALGASVDACRTDVNTVTHREPPVCLLWARRQGA